ncbi:MAG: low specificity L-threonine aldolase [Coriobacteriales bacterium]|nr:low specificity L-threonine aldolase [Coriobacteriales bacterium]
MSETTGAMLHFASDYQAGAHQAIVDHLIAANLELQTGYGFDTHSERARELIRAACACPQAEIHFLVGGTQANATVIDAALRPWQGVIAAESGHINTHESGAIEAGGHKVIGLKQTLGKITADQVDACATTWEFDDNRDHMVMPGMVYISQPTEFGTLYSLKELEALSEVCKAHNMLLYVDGARLAYALATPQNDVSLADLARLTSAFYIGGTKCGSLYGEAVVLAQPELFPHFFAQVKQHGALLAKGFGAGIQFEAFFEDGLYERVGIQAIKQADRLRAGFSQKGIPLAIDSPTNQVFLRLNPAQLERLAQQVEYGFWENTPEGDTIVRLATSWYTKDEDVDALLELF